MRTRNTLSLSLALSLAACTQPSRPATSTPAPEEDPTPKDKPGPKTTPDFPTLAATPASGHTFERRLEATLELVETDGSPWREDGLPWTIYYTLNGEDPRTGTGIRSGTSPLAAVKDYTATDNAVRLRYYAKTDDDLYATEVFESSYTVHVQAGEIAGSVHFGADAAPIHAALYDHAPPFNAPAVVDLAQDCSDCTSWSFRFANLAFDRYYLVAYSDNDGDGALSSGDEATLWDEDPSVAQAQPIDVAVDDPRREGIEMYVAIRGVVRGTIRVASDWRTYAMRAVVYGYRPNANTPGLTREAELGPAAAEMPYEIGNLPTEGFESFRVAVLVDTSGGDWSADARFQRAGEFSLTPQSAVAEGMDVDVPDTTLGTVSGTVRLHEDFWTDRVLVYIRENDGQGMNDTTHAMVTAGTPDNGVATFTAYNVPAGTNYYAQAFIDLTGDGVDACDPFFSSTAFQVIAGSTTQGVEVLAPAPDTVTVEGTITWKAVAGGFGGYVALYDTDPAVNPFNPITFACIRRNDASATALFRAYGMPPEILQYWAAGGISWSHDGIESDSFPRSTGPVTVNAIEKRASGLDLTWGQGAISGRLRVAAAPAAQVAGAVRAARPAEPFDAYFPARSAVELTRAEDGSAAHAYEIIGLDAGSYDISAGYDRNGDQNVTGGERVFVTTVTLQADQQATVDIDQE